MGDFGPVCPIIVCIKQRRCCLIPFGRVDDDPSALEGTAAARPSVCHIARGASRKAGPVQNEEADAGKREKEKISGKKINKRCDLISPRTHLRLSSSLEMNFLFIHPPHDPLLFIFPPRNASAVT